MSNIFTDKVGNGQSLKEFMYVCAEGFGVLKSSVLNDNVNDDSWYEYKTNNYYLDEANKLRKLVKELEVLSDAEILSVINVANDKLKTDNSLRIKEQSNLLESYENMLKKVKAWKPPTEEHEEYKKFMIHEILVAEEFECFCDYKYGPIELDAGAYKKEYISKWNDEINYNMSVHEKNIAKITARNKWVQELLESIAKL